MYHIWNAGTVYVIVRSEVVDAILQPIDMERNGTAIQYTAKNVIVIFVEVGKGRLTCYQEDLESAVLTSIAVCYTTHKASVLLL